MSTHSRIGIIDPDGSVRSIYCHFDGYLAGVGMTLAKSYTAEDRIEALLALGELSSLGDDLSSGTGEPDESPTIAYHRDRHEALTPAARHRNVAALLDDERGGFNWLYLWKAAEKRWYYLPPPRQRSSDEPLPLPAA